MDLDLPSREAWRALVAEALAAWSTPGEAVLKLVLTRGREWRPSGPTALVTITPPGNDALPPERWTRASDALILHGRRICRPTPLCDRCRVRGDCDYYKKLGPKTLGRPKTRRPSPRRMKGPMAQGSGPKKAKPPERGKSPKQRA